MAKITLTEDSTTTRKEIKAINFSTHLSPTPINFSTPMKTTTTLLNSHRRNELQTHPAKTQPLNSSQKFTYPKNAAKHYRHSLHPELGLRRCIRITH